MAHMSLAPQFHVPREVIQISDNILNYHVPVKNTLAIGNTGRRIDIGPVVYVQRISNPEKVPLPVMQIVGSVWAADEAFHAIVERFEPGTHQFLPMDVRLADGSPSGIPYYIFNVCQRIPSVDVGRSETYKRPGSDRVGFVLRDDKLVVHRHEIVDKHVWRDDYFFNRVIFCSDEIKRALQSAKFEMLDFFRVRVEPAQEN
jgi:hypothetical protein